MSSIYSGVTGGVVRVQLGRTTGWWMPRRMKLVRCGQRVGTVVKGGSIEY